jgi:hypothetical protein
MNSQKRFAGWLTAALIGAAAVATTPLLFGGGGDEGVDILPFAGGLPSGTELPPKPALGYITVEKTTRLSYDDRADWKSTGILFAPHKLSDVFIGHMGHEPWGGMTSIDVVAKGTQHLSFGRIAGFVHMDGRYEMTDLDPNDRETLTLVGHWYEPALSIVIVGVRGSHTGSIANSFVQIDRVEASPLANGLVDLKAFRQQSIVGLRGTGRDVAIGIVLSGSSDNVVSSWAAFNVDDSAALYDVENHGD